MIFKKKSLNNVFFALLLIIIAVLLINISVSSYKIYVFKEKISGQAIGLVNISVQTSVSINMTRDSINWSFGTIDSGNSNATLYTNGENNGVVQRGNWSGDNAKALIIENLGGMNCSISIMTSKSAHSLFNSASNSNEQYQIKVSDKETGSCSGNLKNTWLDVNVSEPGTKYCNHLGYSGISNEIYIDVLLTVPYDLRNTGEQSDTITVTGNVAI